MRKIRDSDRRAAFKQELAQQFRQEPSQAERYMWNVLRDKRFTALRFRRQQPIGPYIVDFYCSAAKLVIELDGNLHGRPEHEVRDDARTHWLEQQGLRVIRIWNSNFLRDQQAARRYIAAEIERTGLPHPEIRSANFDPPSRGG
ncbi:MAG TPA: endonuclease domain-containing protein [Rhizomicrobium sp.]|nr:endonuclease domain-containing protein [Rhizomicrobium sp.]